MPRGRYRPDKDDFAPWWNAWSLMWNTNSTNPKLIYPIQVVYDYMISHIADYVKPTPGVNILRVENMSAIEQSPRQHRYHIHSKLVILSTGLLDLDYDKMKAFMEKQLRQVKGFKSIAFYHTILAGYNNERNYEEYLKKNPIIARKGKSKFNLLP